MVTTGGRRLLDFTSGIGVTSTGHCHPKVVAAVQQQAANLIHAQINIYYHRPILELVERFARWYRPGWTSSSLATVARKQLRRR